MTVADDRQPPPGTTPLEHFYDENPLRRDSHVLSYGSGWHEPGWSDRSHIVEILWFGATHEVVTFYISYDWTRLGPGQVARDSVRAAAADLTLDSGTGLGRLLGDLDLATSDVRIRVLAVLASDIQCHELLWDWRWLQHHPEGYTHLQDRLRDHNQTTGPHA